MEVLVTYDVSTESTAGRSRLRRVANICLAYGQRVQKSVFECSLTAEQLETLRQRLAKIADPAQDSVRVYRLLEPRSRHLWTYGIDTHIDFNDVLIT
jgi:CRISPR-associated protein Cas2